MRGRFKSLTLLQVLGQSVDVLWDDKGQSHTLSISRQALHWLVFTKNETDVKMDAQVMVMLSCGMILNHVRVTLL